MRSIIAITGGTQRCQDGARDADNNNAHSASSNIVFGFSDVRRLLSVGNLLHLLFLVRSRFCQITILGAEMQAASQVPSGITLQDHEPTSPLALPVTPSSHWIVRLL